MSVEQCRAIVARFYEELWNGRNLGVADEIIAPGCVTHQLSSGAEPVGAPRGPEAVKQHVAEWLAGFPDMRFTVEEVIAEADRVMSRSVMRGTHSGTWLGIPPTGRRVSVRLVVIQRVEGGKIVEDWVLTEALGFFQQLKLVPATDEILAEATK
jgi:predicted ester cyclase